MLHSRLSKLGVLGPHRPVTNKGPAIVATGMTIAESESGNPSIFFFKECALLIKIGVSMDFLTLIGMRQGGFTSLKILGLDFVS